MKYLLTAAAYAALTDEATKALYKQSGDNYVLNVEGMPDFEGMERKNAELLNEKKQGDEQRRADAKAAQEAADALAKKNGDVQALEASYQKQMADMKASYEGQISGLNGSLTKTLVGNVAQKLATDLCGDNAAVILPHILPRLAVELVGDQHITRVLDANGKPTALDVEALGKEFGGNKLFAGILKGPGSQGTPRDPNPNAPTQKTPQQMADPMYDVAMSAIKNMPDVQ